MCYTKENCTNSYCKVSFDIYPDSDHYDNSDYYDSSDDEYNIYEDECLRKIDFTICDKCIRDKSIPPKDLLNHLQEYTCGGECGYSICKSCFDNCTNTGSCKSCGEFLCEDERDLDIDFLDCNCYSCWIKILKETKPDDVDEEFIGDYLTDILDIESLKYKNQVYKRAKKYLCKHYSTKDYFVHPEDTNEDPCFKCYLNACVYGTYPDAFQKILFDRMFELFELSE